MLLCLCEAKVRVTGVLILQRDIDIENVATPWRHNVVRLSIYGRWGLRKMATVLQMTFLYFCFEWKYTIYFLFNSFL